MRELTVRQERFVVELLAGKSGAEAARAAGYASNSPARADQAAYQLLAKPHVAIALAARRNRIRQELDISEARVLAELCRVAYGDPRAMFDETGRMKSIHELAPEVAAMLDVEAVQGASGRSVIVKTGATMKVKALSVIARIMGYLDPEKALPANNPQINVQVNVGLVEPRKDPPSN